MKENSSKRAVVIITGRSGFPDGTGAATRMRTWAKGLLLNGYVPWVVPLKPSEPAAGETVNSQVAGCVDGINFRYAPGELRVKKTLLGKCLLAVCSIFRLWRVLAEIDRKHGIRVIYYYSPEHISFLLIAYMACRRYGARLFGEHTEALTNQRRLTKLVFDTIGYRLFDGFIVISRYLHEEIKGRLRPGTSLRIVPILVDLDLYKDHLSDDELENRILYCGSLDHTGEVSALLQIFAVAHLKFPDWRLVVVGILDDKLRREFSALCSQLRIESSVTFTGSVPNRDVPAYLQSAKILVLPRCSGIFSTAGFPTKLGEYLATGHPVVSTATGDIPEYLTDGYDAYLVPPGDLQAFASRLCLVIEDMEAAKEVGRRGLETAGKYFDYRKGCRTLAEMIEDNRANG